MRKVFILSLILIFTVSIFADAKIETVKRNNNVIVKKIDNNKVAWKAKVGVNDLDSSNPADSYSIESDKVVVFVPTIEKNIWTKITIYKGGEIITTERIRR